MGVYQYVVATCVTFEFLLSARTNPCVVSREKVNSDTRSAMLVQARWWVPQSFAVGSTHDRAARMEMFTCLTKRIARHLPVRDTHNVKFQFYPTIKVNLLSGNFLLLLLFYFYDICYCDLFSCRTGGGACIYVCMYMCMYVTCKCYSSCNITAPSR
jgi:hypothetical protein